MSDAFLEEFIFVYTDDQPGTWSDNLTQRSFELFLPEYELYGKETLEENEIKRVIIAPGFFVFHPRAEAVLYELIKAREQDLELKSFEQIKIAGLESYCRYWNESVHANPKDDPWVKKYLDFSQDKIFLTNTEPDYHMAAPFSPKQLVAMASGFKAFKLATQMPDLERLVFIDWNKKALGWMKYLIDERPRENLWEHFENYCSRVGARSAFPKDLLEYYPLPSNEDLHSFYHALDGKKISYHQVSLFDAPDFRQWNVIHKLPTYFWYSNCFRVLPSLLMQTPEERSRAFKRLMYSGEVFESPIYFEGEYPASTFPVLGNAKENILFLD